MKKQKGFSLVGILFIIVLILTTAGGVVVWEKKVSSSVVPIPSPVPTSTPIPIPPETETPLLQKEFGKTWVWIYCGQCEDPPWNKEWRELHSEEAFYPHNEEGKVVSEYYQKQGITIFDIKFVDPEGNVCAGCACPGYTVYLLVSNSDVQKMIELGYQKTQ